MEFKKNLFYDKPLLGLNINVGDKSIEFIIAQNSGTSLRLLFKGFQDLKLGNFDTCKDFSDIEVHDTNLDEDKKIFEMKLSLGFGTAKNTVTLGYEEYLLEGVDNFNRIIY